MTCYPVLLLNSSRLTAGLESRLALMEDLLVKLTSRVDGMESSSSHVSTNPFIERHKFFETYQQMIDHGISSVRRSWLGLLNMMFAMATSANFGHHRTVTADAPNSSSDLFYKRAMILSDRQIRYATSLEVSKRVQCAMLSPH